MTDRELMQQALEALNVYASKAEHKRTHADNCAAEEIITALRSRLEQPEHGPVAIYQYQIANGSWIDQEKDSHDYNVKLGQATVRVVYTRPQPAAWVGLTDEDIARAGNLKRMLPYAYARAIEAKLREKNGGAA